MEGTREASRCISRVGPGATEAGRRHTSSSRCLETCKVLLFVNPWRTLQMGEQHSPSLLESITCAGPWEVKSEEGKEGLEGRRRAHTLEAPPFKGNRSFCDRESKGVGDVFSC